MGTNPYFPNYVYDNEKALLHDLVNEAVNIYGINCYYLPKTLSDTVDYLYTEDPRTFFSQAYSVVTYLESMTRSKGIGTLFQNLVSKFAIRLS